MSNFNYVNDILRINAQAPQPLDTTAISSMPNSFLTHFQAGQKIAQNARERALWEDNASLKMLENQKRKEYLGYAETPEQIGNYYNMKTPTSIPTMSAQPRGVSTAGTSAVQGQASQQPLTKFDREWNNLLDAGFSKREAAMMMYPNGAKMINENQQMKSLLEANSATDVHSMAHNQTMGGYNTLSNGVSGGLSPYGTNVMPRSSVTPAPLDFTPVDLSAGFNTGMTNTTPADEANLLSVAFDNTLTPDQKQARMLSIGQSSGGSSTGWPYSWV